ncbi:hypothetical protein HB364_32475 [Pseudoflavitalea sp. X16]|uniref:hypothetical protein n=1 Tax=Paraflavitalea devenefica TaxID=2716334 RepID=UPI00141FD1F1|nr:hypothetical protein [Paraflavitalea devenefica]NII29839.1 hypothetical protein [Paraflavitalea devenefica]
MRKLIAILCLITFVALQYGKVVSYWHCRLAAPVNCGCDKKLVDHTDKDHPTPVTIAKEKAEEVFLSHEALRSNPAVIIADLNSKQSLYQSLIPADHTASIFQPPKA